MTAKLRIVLFATASLGAASSANAAPVSLACNVAAWHGSTPLDASLPRPSNMKWTISFETNGSKADATEEQTRDGSPEMVQLLGDLILTPGYAKIRAKDVRTPSVFVDYALEIDRGNLTYTGTKVLPGLMTVKFDGTCQLVKLAPRKNKF